MRHPDSPVLDKAGTADLFGPAAPAGAAPREVAVLIPVAVDKAYTYALPPGIEAPPGSLVHVPLATRTTLGIVWGEAEETVPPKRLRAIEAVLDVPPLGDQLRAFIDWVARYTLTPRGMVLRMALRAPEAVEPEKPMRAVRYTGREPGRMTAARARVLDVCQDGETWSRTGLAAAAGVSPSVVDGLVDLGVLAPLLVPPRAPPPPPDPDHVPAKLNTDQAGAAAGLAATVGAGFSATLLEGVTGAGKTDVYFEAIAACLRAGRQALVLMPEIALTAAFRDRFAARFGSPPGEWHSEVPPRARAKVWRGVAEGTTRVVVGARSALFLPFRELGLVIVDEEHDQSYKQEEWATYHARDMAVVRARLGGFPAVLVSATPSIETRVNAEAGRYGHLVLPRRAGGAELPQLRAIDMRTDGPPRGRWLAPNLIGAVTETIGRGEQALLFLNRRGYAPLTLCRTCGHRFHCPNCSAWLVEHRFRGTLECHHCGHTERRPTACPNCGDAESLVPCGPGVERIAEEVAELFPAARRIVLSSDMGGLERMRAELKAVADGEADIVIGTQLVAKGHTFPKLTLVGVVDADLGLAQGDPRAAERSFQLLAQVTGRAGRVEAPGTGLLQTYIPEHPVIRALVSGAPERFYATEIAERERGKMPPFGRLAAIIVSGTTREEAMGHARALARAAPADPHVEVLGPAEAPLSLIRGRYRYRLLAHAPRTFDLSAWLRRWMDAAPPPRGSLGVQVDVDPQSFL